MEYQRFIPRILETAAGAIEIAADGGAQQTYDACRNEARAEEDAALAPQPVAHQSVDQPRSAQVQKLDLALNHIDFFDHTISERHYVIYPAGIEVERAGQPRALKLNAILVDRGPLIASESQEAHEFRPDTVVRGLRLGPLGGNHGHFAETAAIEQPRLRRPQPTEVIERAPKGARRNRGGVATALALTRGRRRRHILKLAVDTGGSHHRSPGPQVNLTHIKISLYPQIWLWRRASSLRWPIRPGCGS